MADTGKVMSLRAVAQRLPEGLGRRVGDAVLSAVDKAVVHEWERASVQARQLNGTSIDDKVKVLSKSFAQELGTVGALAGGAAALPAAGTAVALSTAVADFGWFTTRASRLILTIAALHGHDQATVEERRVWILSILVFGEGASQGFRKLAGELGVGLGKKATTRVPASVLKAINSKLGRTIVTKYGTKRGVIALGRALPFGFGAVIGGGANYIGTMALARHANKFFRDLPYTDEASAADGSVRTSVESGPAQG